MVVASPAPIQTEQIRDIELPIIDLLAERSQVSKLLVKACEEFGFFKVINHGIPDETITKIEEESFKFFAKPASDKQQAGPADPYGYGSKNIGFNGDIGQVEYLLLRTNPLSISHKSKCISNHPNKFSFAVIGYIEEVRKLACQILDLIAEGLWVPDTPVFSRLISDIDSDSLLRLNHYPPFNPKNNGDRSATSFHHQIGFGEHTDPQILTILRSNGVQGLQISLEEGVWVPVSPYPTTAFCVNVGDLLQAMTNGRFLSVRHRAIVNSHKSRLSIAYFGAPSLCSIISCLPKLATIQKPPLYRSFTWAEFKRATYSRQLGESRLNLFSTFDDVENGE
ncbi:Gibberellin 2-beta-dioxygenase 4 [Forsythia ovata]|uniref:gibberellin 2beta-dioxygenase n=1 Tax=Forsythia ovata TaxID=205694 RepID=A0ABD1PKT6_9LAMI